MQISSSEKRLLTLLSVAVFILANGFGYVLISGAMDAVDRDRKKLSQQLGKLEAAKGNAAEAEEKRAWIDAHLKPYANEGVRETHLDEQITGALTSDLDVELSKNAPMATIEGEFFIKSRYRTNVKGPWPDVKEFLWRLQKPAEFRFVPRLNMVPRKSEEDDSEQLVEVTVEIEKWWPKPEGFSDASVLAEENLEQPAVPVVETPAGEKPASEPTPPEPAADPAKPTPSEPPPPPVIPPAGSPTDSPKPTE